jgi:hypothetical protein
MVCTGIRIAAHDRIPSIDVRRASTYSTWALELKNTSLKLHDLRLQLHDLLLELLDSKLELVLLRLNGLGTLPIVFLFPRLPANPGEGFVLVRHGYLSSSLRRQRGR